MTASYHRGKAGTRYPHYWCKENDCPNKNKTIPRKDVHARFEKILKDLTPKPQILKLAEAVLRDVWQKRQNGEMGVSESNLAQLRDLTTKIETLTGRVIQATNPALISLYEAELENLLKQKTALEAAINSKRFERQDFDQALKLVFAYLEHPLNHWKSPEFIEQRTLLNIYFNQGISYNKLTGFGTPKLPLVVEALTSKSASKFKMVEMAGVKPASSTFLLSHCSQD